MKFEVVPNIVNITYGRDVGYKIEQETFDDATHSISSQRFVKSWALNSGESPIRSLVKAYSYRCCGTITTIVISYIITGQFIISLGIVPPKWL
jgi:hypothetical protein